MQMQKNCAAPRHVHALLTRTVALLPVHLQILQHYYTRYVAQLSSCLRTCGLCGQGERISGFCLVV